MEPRSIGIDEMDGFQIDDNGRLYWRGTAVILEKRLKLEGYQIFLATLATIGTLLSGVHPFAVTFGWLSR